MQRNGRGLQRVANGFRLVLGSFAVHPLMPDFEEPASEIRVAVDEVLGRPGSVIYEMQSDRAAGSDGDGRIVTTSPRFEAVIMLSVAVGAVIAAVRWGGDVTARSASFPTFFGLTWSIGWVALTIYRLWLQGRAFDAVMEALSRAAGSVKIQWTTAR